MLGTTNCPHQFLHSQWNSQDTNVTKNGWKSSSKNSTGRQHGFIFCHKYGGKLPNHSISFHHLSGNGGSLSPSKQQVVYSLCLMIPKALVFLLDHRYPKKAPDIAETLLPGPKAWRPCLYWWGALQMPRWLRCWGLPIASWNASAILGLAVGGWLPQNREIYG